MRQPTYELSRNVIKAAQLKDLAEIEPLLINAYERLRLYCRDDNKIDVRFESEKEAVSLMFHLHRLFRQGQIPEEIPALASCHARLVHLLEMIDRDDTISRVVRISVERQVVSNLFMVVLLECYKEQRPAPDKIELKRLLARFDKNIQAKNTIDTPAPPVTFRVKAIHLSSSWLVLEGESKKQVARQLQEMLTEQRIQQASVRPYDPWRLKFLKDISSE